MIGHEEIWDFSTYSKISIKESYYKYALSDITHDKLLNISKLNDLEMVVETADIIGNDIIIIKVVDIKTGNTKCIMWKTSHEETFSSYKINATQFQVISSLLLFCELILENNFCNLQLNALQISDIINMSAIEDKLRKHKIVLEVIDPNLVN